MIPQKVTSHVTQNPNNTGERGASVCIGNKTVKNRKSKKKKKTLRKFFFRFFVCFVVIVFRGSCLATSNEKLECEGNAGGFYASVNGKAQYGLSE